MLRTGQALLISFSLLMGTHVFGEEPSSPGSPAPTETRAAKTNESTGDKTSNAGTEATSPLPTAPVPAARATAEPAPAAPAVAEPAPAAPAPEAPVPATPKTAPTKKQAVARTDATAPLSREQALKEWKFLQETSKDTGEERTESVLFQLNEFLRLNPDWEFSDEARLLKSELQLRRGDYRSAAVDLLVLIYEYPDSHLVFQAKRMLTDVVDRKFDKKMKSLLSDISKGSEATEKPARLVLLLKTLSEQAGDVLFDPLVMEFDRFFCRYPSYTGLDELNVLFGDLQTKKKKYVTAQTYYQKLLALYPESRFRPRAQRSLGDLYASNLKNIDAAVNAYQEVIHLYPRSDETAYAYEQTAKLEEQQKHYALAVEINEKIIKLYPNTDYALRAFNNKARLLREELEKPNDAVRTYQELADMFMGSDGAAEALKVAAALARKQKNYKLESALYARFANECPTNKEAPDMLFQAALVSEEDLADTEAALDLFNQLTNKYPESKPAQKAEKHINALMRKKFAPK
jgi:TolA-binding protein